MPGRAMRSLDSTLRGRNALLNIFELWVGLAGVISGAVFLYSPASIDHDALAHTVGYGLAATWTIAYMIAGAGIWIGLLKPSPKWEVAALWILGGATSANGISILGIFGIRGAATAVTLISLALASWARAWFVQAAALQLAQEAQHAPC